MVIEKLRKGGFAIRRGVAYFSFFVDHDSACFGRPGWKRVYVTRGEAEEELAEIRKRNARRAKENRKRRAGSKEETHN